MIRTTDRAGPLISDSTPGLEGALGSNINGPSPIVTPSWLETGLGKYLLYFAHHNGTYIRLAYAEAVEGPWTIYSPGVLSLERSEARGHVASPDLRIDTANRCVELFYHGPIPRGQPRRFSLETQATFVAHSRDGVNFIPTGTGPVAPPYLRHFDWNGVTYGVCMALDPGLPSGRSGQLLRRGDDGVFELGPRIIPGMRHAAVALQPGFLEIFYTAVGDAPECIKYARVSLTEDWRNWRVTDEMSLVSPTELWEGADLPIAPSLGGPSNDREHALRDPAYLRDGAREYLFYSGAGERNIGCVRLLRGSTASAS